MAKFPTYEGMVKKVAEEALDGYIYKGKTLREWVDVLAQTQWIPVSNGLPKLYEEVIVTDIETSDTYLSRYIGNGYWECDNGSFNNRIIAWQPKPQPYKAESEDKTN
jgi:hypothetical protein